MTTHALTICIDIDGTLTKPYAWLEYTAKAYNKTITQDMYQTCYTAQALDIDGEEYSTFYKSQSRTFYYDLCEFRPHAQRVMEDLNQAHRVHIVTSREKQFADLTQQLLTDYQIPGTLHVLESFDKVTPAKDLGCQLFIEDNIRIATNLAEAGFPVLLMDCAYNRKPLHQRIRRVSDWEEVESVIQAMTMA
jgi:hypothetical protein